MMSKAGFYINLLARRHAFLTKLKFSPYVLPYGRRCFCTKNVSNGEDQNPKKEVSVSEESSNDVKSLKSPKLKLKAKLQSAPTEESKEAAKKKLFSLLTELKVDSGDSSKTSSSLNLTKAVKRITKKERFKDIKKEKPKSPYDDLKTAAKAVASSISGDPKTTLSQLNEKLATLNLAKQAAKATDKVQEDTMMDEDISKNLMSSVEEVASNVADGSVPIKSELTQRLMKLSAEGKLSPAPRKPMEDLFKGMKIDISSEQRQADRMKQQRELSDPPQGQLRSTRPSVNIFQAAPFDIFKFSEVAVEDSKKTVWQSLEEKQLKLLVQYAPTNPFEEMIMWTEQGKHWKFPIDNQTDMGEEEKVGFQDHVFLEQHLHGFPTKGPIRHFMELVCVGLSQNPFITVDRKIENIDWFRNYFDEKKDILEQTGALG